MKKTAIRNNNPGNIRRNRANRWMGACANQTDPSFVQFTHTLFGYRAMMVLLKNYVKRPDCRQLDQIISRWAPPCENHTHLYIDFVAKRMGVVPTATLNLSHRPTLLALCAAITRMEHGVKGDFQEMEQAWKLIADQ